VANVEDATHSSLGGGARALLPPTQFCASTGVPPCWTDSPPWRPKARASSAQLRTTDRLYATQKTSSWRHSGDDATTDRIRREILSPAGPDVAARWRAEPYPGRWERRQRLWHVASEFRSRDALADLGLISGRSAGLWLHSPSAITCSAACMCQLAFFI
jgi:hypothetical protein